MDSPVFTKTKKVPTEKKPTSLRLPIDVAAALDAVCLEFGISRTEAILQSLQWALAEHYGKKQPESEATLLAGEKKPKKK